MSEIVDPPPRGPTVAVHRSADRRYSRFRNQENWLTFDLDGGAGRSNGGCEALENISESRWGPQASARSQQRTTAADVITYVRAGRIHRKDAAGRERVLQAGEFEQTSMGPEDRCLDINPSKSHIAHVFQIFLRPQLPRVERPPERRCFSEADRKGRMFVVASQDESTGLSIAQDARIFSMLLYPGQRVVHRLEAGRAAWLHVAHGAVSVGDLVLGKGDSVGVQDGHISMTAREHSEILAIECAQAECEPHVA